MRIYLAGPMRGIPDFNYPAFFKYAHELRSQGHEVFNPAEIGIHQDEIREIMAVETGWICRKAEAVYLMPGWEKSRGARAEQALAEALDLKIMDGSLPRHPLENTYRSVLPSSTTSPSLSQKSQKYLSQVKSSTTPKDGIGLSLRTKPMLSSVTFWSAGVLTAMAVVILLKWLGGL